MPNAAITVTNTGTTASQKALTGPDGTFSISGLPLGLMQGVTPPQPALDPIRDPERNRYFNTNGQDPTNRQFQMDGVTNTEFYRATAVRVQPLETIQQMNLTTAAHSAEKGFTAGTWANNTTRPGDNGWHASLFEFYSGNILRARNYFNTTGNPNPRFVYNQFGATVGGAIVPSRTFIFGSYEGTIQRGAELRSLQRFLRRKPPWGTSVLFQG